MTKKESITEMIFEILKCSQFMTSPQLVDYITERYIHIGEEAVKPYTGDRPEE